ncbi:MAG TPA: hypothetical protein VFQ52_03625 [Rhizomicrobium sp.]|nr:hypothetical protein [Rhizomicrobium sp.]
MRTVLLALAFAVLPAAARAAAWTLPRHDWQIISGVISSDATRSFDSRGDAVTPARFQRLLLQNDIEWGLDDRLTLLVRTETAYAHTRDGTSAAVNAVDNAIEGGARLRLFQGLGILADDDVLSLEATARTAGAFNFAYSVNASASGGDWGARLLYGSGFRLLDKDGFVNLEAGYRWLSAPRPSQMPIDLTAGLWLDSDWMVMLQSFNMVSGPAMPPYVRFRSHKIEASAVTRLTDSLSLQAGAFFSPAGQDALDERGLCLSIWANF